MLNFMSGSEIEEFEIIAPPAPPVKPDAIAQTLASAREKLSRFLPRAVEIITELAETSENDRVRLAAAESIADRAGLGKSATTQIQVSQTEHDVAELETAELLKGIRANQGVVDEHAPPLDVLIVHESE